MKHYSIVVDGKRFAVTYDKKQAEGIAAANGGKVEEFEFFTPFEKVVAGKEKK